MPASVDLSPLRRFHDDTDLDRLALQAVEATNLPPAARHLLDHQGDMTSRLREHHGEPVQVQALAVQFPADGSHVYAREVLLRTVESDQSVEYGAIEIHLDAISDNGVRESILAARDPLGGILEKAGIGMTSQPTAFFQLEADAILAAHLGLAAGSKLHGRRNQLRLADGNILAEIVEIVPA